MRLGGTKLEIKLERFEEILYKDTYGTYGFD